MDIKGLITNFADQRGIDVDTSDKISANGGEGLMTDVTSIINAVVGILGVVCVIVIIMGGIKYMTSSGDSKKVTDAKNTILYGIIGLIICALAFAIVNFVITTVLKG